VFWEKPIRKFIDYLRWASLCFITIDSVIYIQKVDESPKVKTGDYLSDLTDELEEFGSGSYIEEFVSGGSKNYAFSVFCPSSGKRISKCKVKNIIFEL
jgi:hypothetical protein